MEGKGSLREMRKGEYRDKEFTAIGLISQLSFYSSHAFKERKNDETQNPGDPKNL